MTWAYVVVGGTTLAYGIYSNMDANRRAGNYSNPQAPPPANYTTYDTAGNITGQNTWNPDTQTYEYRTYDYGKQPDKPAAPDASKFSLEYGGPSTVDSGTDGGGNMDWVTGNNKSQKWDPSQPIPASVSPETRAQMQSKLDAYKTAMDTYNNETIPAYNTQLADWNQKKTDFETEQAKTKKILSDTETNMGMSWDERVKKFDDFATAYVDQQHAIVDPQFDKQQRTLDEKMNATGQTGSRAQVDTNAELTKARNLSDTEIANNATMAKYALGQQDFNNNLNTYNAVTSGARADAALAIQKQGTADQATALGNSASLASFSATNNNAYNKWLSDYLMNQATTKSYTDTASGLAYLYGYGKKTGAWGSPSPAAPSGINSGYTPSPYANA